MSKNYNLDSRVYFLVLYLSFPRDWEGAGEDGGWRKELVSARQTAVKFATTVMETLQDPGIFYGANDLPNFWSLPEEAYE